MIRKIIHIDQEKCNGCGICADACHEGAIEIVDGKARLTRDDYCDGFGDCLPGCPTGAISFEEREAAAYDEAAVAEHKREKSRRSGGSQLTNWPTQIKLVPVTAPFFDGSKLLIAADCTAFAYPTIQDDLMAGRVTINGCPKLDGVDYSEKLSQIFAHNDIREITVVRMEVPCCGGLEMAVRRAMAACGKTIPLRVVVVSTDGRMLGERA